jgi:hypothetical protein
MSSLITKGNASGTGSVTLESPNTNSDFTITLPAATGTAMVSGNIPAFSAYMSANQAPTNNALVKCAVDTEVFDTANCFNTSNYRFTPNVAGYYQINGSVAGYSTGTSLTASATIIQKNGSTVAAAQINGSSSFLLLQPTITQIVYLNGSTDYVELYGLVVASGGSQLFVGTSLLYTTFSGCLVRAA